MKTSYKASVVSPFHTLNKKALDTQNKNHPIQEEIHKSLGTVTFSATFERDTRTLEMFKHIPGIIAFTCTLRKGDLLIGEGHGSAAISRINKFVERSVRYAHNAAFLDAVARSTRMLDALHLQPNPLSRDIESPITDKQKSYLTELIKNNVADEAERKRWMSEINGFSKDKASEAIQSFTK